jgi:nitrile hydratase beta subunit
VNGIHDMGGMQGFGQIAPEKDEPIFHEEWEKAIFASFGQLAAQGFFNLDEFRHAIERMGNAHYLESSYYEHWLGAYETLLTEKGVIDKNELERRASQLKEDPDAIPPPTPKGDDKLAPVMEMLIKQGASTAREVSGPPRFKVGERVVTKNMNPPGHTRLPRYVRGKEGTIEIIHGSFVFPDTNAHLQGEKPQYVYAVRFDGSEVWGEHPDGKPDAIYVDLWEDYLEPASGETQV